MESLKILRLWTAAAWADGTLHPREEAALRRFIDNSNDLGSDGRKQALALLSGREEIEVEEVKELGRDAREGVYRAVLTIVRLDGKVTIDEEDWLNSLRQHLDLDAATIARIEAEA